MGNILRAFAALHNRNIPAGDWKVTGPKGMYSVVSHSRSIPSNTTAAGTFTFVLKDPDNNQITLVAKRESNGVETVTSNGEALPHADIDGDVNIKVIVSIPPKYKSVVILYVYYENTGPTAATDPVLDYRFEGKFLSGNLPFPHIPGVG